MKLLILIVSLSILFDMTNLYSQTQALPTIAEVAQGYGAEAQDVVSGYHHLFDRNRMGALQSVDSLSSKGAYSALALALPSVDAAVKPSIVDALSKAIAKDKLIIDCVLLELRNRNFIVVEQGEKKSPPNG